MEKLNYKLGLVKKKLSEVSNSLIQTDFQSSQDQNLFILISNIQDFNNLFGYDTEHFEFNKIIQTIKSDTEHYPYRFSSALHNIYRRRTFYYLRHFNKHYFSTNYSDNKPIKHLLDYFGKFVKNNCFTKEQILKLFEKFLNIPDKFIQLTPLYISNIDSELFTTLTYYYELQTKEYNTYPDSQQFLDKLYYRITELVDDYIDPKFKLKISDRLGVNLQDESNILWAILTIFFNKDKHTNGSRRFTIKEGFQRVVQIIAQRERNNRIFPNHTNLFADITPELFTQKRTELYIAYNLANILYHKDFFDSEFIENISNSLSNILFPYLYSPPNDNNLYFLTTEYMCYQLISSLNIESETQSVQALQINLNSSPLTRISQKEEMIPPEHKAKIIGETAKLLYDKLYANRNNLSKSTKKILDIFSEYKIPNTFSKLFDALSEHKSKKDIILKFETELFTYPFSKVYELYCKLTED
ncbi:MAG: hypothetical protein PVH88_18020 [Ignavibacteria bacterium]|jgi:hypothetical protein